MKARPVETARRLAPDDDIFHAFLAEDSPAWRSWLAVVPPAATITVVVGLGAPWPVVIVAALVAALMTQAVAGPRRVVALTSNHALILDAKRTDRSATRIGRDMVERTRTGVLNERWRFGNRSLVVPREQRAAIDGWQTANG